MPRRRELIRTLSTGLAYRLVKKGGALHIYLGNWNVRFATFAGDVTEEQAEKMIAKLNAPEARPKRSTARSASAQVKEK